MKIKIFAMGLLGMALVGCGDKKAEPAEQATGIVPLTVPTASAAPAGTPGLPTAVVTTPSAPPPPTAAPPPPGAPIPAAPAAAPAAPTGPDSTGARALAILNGALNQYNDPSTRPDADDPRPKPSFPQLKDLSDLVKAGVLKTVPSPPEGKQFAYDRAKNEIILIDKK